MIGALRRAPTLSSSSSITSAYRSLEKRQQRYTSAASSRLAFLAPDLQAAILEGRQPAHLTLEQLIERPIPIDWEEQRAIFELDTARSKLRHRSEASTLAFAKAAAARAEPAAGPFITFSNWRQNRHGFGDHKNRLRFSADFSRVLTARIAALGTVLKDILKRFSYTSITACKRCTGLLKMQWRSGRDSNPRYGFAVYSLSRRAPSTTRPPLRTALEGRASRGLVRGGQGCRRVTSRP